MVDPKLARAYGTLAGFGFIGVALLALPSTRLLDPPPAPEAYLLTLLGLVTGLVCLAVPWDRLDPRWLHLVGVAATAETAATVAVFGQAYVAFYFLIAVLVAYVAPNPRTVGFQLTLIVLALLAPVAYGPEGVRESLSVALVVAPALLLTAALFSYLRLKMVHDRRAYHRFAEQTLVLSSQIAGRQLGGPVGLVPQPDPVPRLSEMRPPPSRWIATVAAALGLPLFAGGLAVAGVKLPDVATAPFESVGIELPNQDPGPATEDPVARSAAAARPDVERARSRSADRRPGARDDRRVAQEGGAAAPAGAPPSPGGTTTGASQGVAPPAPASPAPAAPLPASEGAKAKSPLGDFLDNATQGLQGLLDEIRSAGQ